MSETSSVGRANSKILSLLFNQVNKARYYFRYPDTLVIDGTVLACPKNYIPSSDVDLSENRTLFGTEQKDRVFVQQQRARKLLTHFATGKLGGQKKEMVRANVDELLELLATDRPNETNLYSLVAELSNNGAVVQAPAVYEKFLRELAKSTPVCGAMQIGEDVETIRILEEIVADSVDIASSTDSRRVAILHKKVPAIMECLLPIRKATGVPGRHLPLLVRNILRALLKVVADMYNGSP